MEAGYSRTLVNLARFLKLMAEAGDGEAMVQAAERTLAALRYAQSEEARRVAPFEATLGEIDCLVDLVLYHQMRLEDLIDR